MIHLIILCSGLHPQPRSVSVLQMSESPFVSEIVLPSTCSCGFLLHVCSFRHTYLFSHASLLFSTSLYCFVQVEDLLRNGPAPFEPLKPGSFDDPQDEAFFEEFRIRLMTLQREKEKKVRSASFCFWKAAGFLGWSDVREIVWLFHDFYIVWRWIRWPQPLLWSAPLDKLQNPQHSEDLLVYLTSLRLQKKKRSVCGEITFSRV